MIEIEEYLTSLQKQVKEIKYTEKNPCIVAQKHYECAQMFLAVGRQKEALPYLELSWSTLQQYQRDDVYGGLYYHVGVTYAIALDFLGELMVCEHVFQDLTKYNPDGFHLGDYAYFLHRRKRDFDNAER